MVGIKYKRAIDLNGIIVPQGLSVDGEYISVFDKINTDEGRLYRLDSRTRERHLIMEVDDGECFFGRDGLIYILYTDENSLVEIYSPSGNKIKDITFKGTVYFIDVDTAGNIYAISSEEGDMLIRVLDARGSFIREMHSRNMPLLTALFCDDEHVYASGFSESISHMIEKLNCMSYIIASYDIGSEGHKAIVTRLLKHDDTLISALSGDDRDRIILIDEKSGEKREFDASGSGAYSVYDMTVSDNELLVLCSDNKIRVYQLTEVEAVSNKAAKQEKRQGIRKSRNDFVTYMIFIKNSPRDALHIFLKYAAPLTMLIMLYLQFSLEKKGIKMPLGESMRAVVLISGLITIMGIVIKNVGGMFAKRSRIDNLLDIYNRIDSVNAVLFKNSLFLGGIWFIITFAMFYRNGLGDNTVWAAALSLAAACTGVLYGLSIWCVKRFKAYMGDMVFELLSFDGKERESFGKVASEVRKLRKLGTERYRIKVLTRDRISRGVIRLVNKWSRLRRKITGDTGRLNDSKEYLIFDLNLENRDIRYSRLSVIEDFICYLEKMVNITSVVIETEDGDKEKV